MLSVAAQLLLCSCCLPAAAALKFLVVPMPGDNSPVLDIMSVAAQLQSRCAGRSCCASGCSLHEHACTARRVTCSAVLYKGKTSKCVPSKPPGQAHASKQAS